MPDIQVRHYDPKGSGYAPRHTRLEWQRHRTFLTRLHNEGVCRRVMVLELAQKGFHVKEGQLNRQMTKWSLRASEGPVSATEEVLPTEDIPLEAKRVQESSSTPLADDRMMCEQIEAPGTAGEHTHVDSKKNIPSQEIDAYRQRPTGLLEIADNLFDDSPPTSQSNTKQLNPSLLPIAKGICVSKNTNESHGRARIFQKLKLIELTNGHLPWTSCQCLEFFCSSAPIGIYDHYTRIHQAVLTEPLSWGGSVTNDGFEQLYQGLALLRCCRKSLDQMENKINLSTQNPSGENIKALRDAVPALVTASGYYASLLERPQVKNKIAFSLSYELISLCFSNSSLRVEADLAGHLRGIEESITRLFNLVLTQMDRYGGARSRLWNFEEVLNLLGDSAGVGRHTHEPHRQFISATDPVTTNSRTLLLEDCRKLLSAHKITLAQYLWRQKSCDKNCQHHQPALHCFKHLASDRLKVAMNIAWILRPKLQQTRWYLISGGNTTHINVFFDAVGLVVADEIWSFIKQRPEGHFETFDSLVALVDSATELLEMGNGTEALRTRFVQALWICDPHIENFGPEGLHLGPCYASKCWKELGRRIVEFDEHLPVQLGSSSDSTGNRQENDRAHNKSPAHNKSSTITGRSQLVNTGHYDNRSMITNSSKSSFNMFERLSIRLRNKESMTSSRLKNNESKTSLVSKISKWSGHMSVESWRLDVVLGVTTKQENLLQT